MCSSSSSGRSSDEPNDPDYIPNLAMGYGDDSSALKLSLNKKPRNERRLRWSQAQDYKNIEVSSEEGTGAGEDTRRLEALTWDALVDEWVHTVTFVICGQ